MALLTDAGGTHIADVDANGRLKVQPPTDGTNAGAMFLVGKSDLSSPSNTGSITGSSQGLLGMANVVTEYDKGFANNVTLVNNDLIAFLSVMSYAVTTNVLSLNAAGVLTAGAYVGHKSPRHFKIERGSDRIFGFRFKLDQSPITNTTFEVGAFLFSGTSAPSGGVFFRYGADGTLKGVSISQSGIETVTSNITMAAPTDFHEYVIVVGRSGVTFFIDEIPVASLGIQSDAASVVTGESYPIAFRLMNNAAVLTAQKVYITRTVSATMGGSSGADIRYLQALRGDFGLQTVVGTAGSLGSTANWTNSTVPATATLSNTAAGYTTLGGNFLFVGLAAAETDYALFAYQVPAGTLTNMGRTLVVRGVTIDAYVSVAAGTPTVATVLHWGFGVGATAVSLAGAEGPSAKGVRRGFLGIQSTPILAVAGTELRRISQTLEQPVAVNAGEYFHIILRIPLGAATIHPTIRGGVFVDASWE